MTESRLPDYLDHIRQTATHACSFVEGQRKQDFLADKRTQQAVILSLLIIGEALPNLLERMPAVLEDAGKIAGDSE